MNDNRISFVSSFETELRDWLSSHPDGHERGALVLFRKINREVVGLALSTRFVAVSYIQMADDWVIESSPIHLRINLRLLPEVYFRCEQEGLELGFVHSHPSGALYFSGKDDVNEQNILRGYAGCNGPQVSLVAMVLCDDKWLGRVRTGTQPEHTQSVRHVAVLGEGIALHLRDNGANDDDASLEMLQRQEVAFGRPFNRKLSSLRAVVVGAGGTGSPTATLLARSGVGELVIIDGDNLEGSNLNRVRGYRHADIGKNKAVTLAGFIDSLGLPIKVASIPEFVDRSPVAVDAIASADIIFGCTDDVVGRDTLTQAMYYYCLVYIDMGLTGMIATDEAGLPYLRDHRGRVSTMLPEFGACLRCQRVVTDEKIKYELAVRKNPELAKLDPETLRREHYLTGGGESAPGVGPFTSAVADNAVASFMHLVRPYRRMSSDLRQDNIWQDFVHLGVYSNMPAIDENCFCCGQDGLLCAPEGNYRLGTPSLGKLVL